MCHVRVCISRQLSSPSDGPKHCIRNSFSSFREVMTRRPGRALRISVPSICTIQNTCITANEASPGLTDHAVPHCSQLGHLLLCPRQLLPYAELLPYAALHLKRRSLFAGSLWEEMQLARREVFRELHGCSRYVPRLVLPRPSYIAIIPS